MDDVPPTDISRGATLQGKEYGWSLSSFPDALVAAEARSYACLGGQFQFRLGDRGTCEMYWLSADSREREPEETWADYSHRSCAEVLSGFQHLASATDFGKEALNWPSVQIDPTGNLVFVAYFVTEDEVSELNRQAQGFTNSSESK
jgi:predicted ATPase